MAKKPVTKINSKLFKNSFWGLAGSIVQNIFLSLFYIIVARHYVINEFAEYIVASSLYQMVVAFSSMGLGQWFIREVAGTKNKRELIHKFLKIQTLFGAVFFLCNVITVFFLYEEGTVRILSILFAANIIFDNIIYAIKHVNIAEYAQKKTVSVLTIEAVAKFIIACTLFIYPFSIVILVILIVGIRFITLNLFLRIGAADDILLKGFWKADVKFKYITYILKKYWPFAIIGSAYVIYWKLAVLIISKMLPVSDVTHYENSFKIFSLAQLIPVVIASTVLPRFVELQRDDNHEGISKLYKKLFKFCTIYGLLAFSFIYSFADIIIPLLFGAKYADTSMYTKEMFLTILIMPTAMLQAQILIAFKLEKLDMWFNINSVIINSSICLIGLTFFKSLTVVNYAIFISFVIFHLSQDIVLIKKRIIKYSHLFGFIFAISICVIGYIGLSKTIQNPYLLFTLFWGVILPIALFNELKEIRLKK